MMFPPSQIHHILPKEAWLIRAADDELSDLIRFLRSTGDFSPQDPHPTFYFYDLVGDPLFNLASLSLAAVSDWLHTHPGVSKQADAERSVRTQAVTLFFGKAGTHLASRRQHFKHQRGTAEQRKLLLMLEIDYLNQKYDNLRSNLSLPLGADPIPNEVQSQCIAIANEPNSLSVGLASDHLRDALLKELHRAERRSPSRLPKRSAHHKTVAFVSDPEGEDIIRREYGHLGLQHTYYLNNALFSHGSLKTKVESHLSFLDDFRSYLSDPKGFSRMHDPHLDSMMEMAASEALKLEQVVISADHSAIITHVPLMERAESAELFRRQAKDLPRNSQETRRMIAAFHMYADFIENPSSQKTHALSNPFSLSLIRQFMADHNLELSYATALSNAYANDPSTKCAVDHVLSSLEDTNSVLKRLHARSR